MATETAVEPRIQAHALGMLGQAISRGPIVIVHSRHTLLSHYPVVFEEQERGEEEEYLIYARRDDIAVLLAERPELRHLRIDVCGCCHILVPTESLERAIKAIGDVTEGTKALVA